MTPRTLHNELKHIGTRITAWRVELFTAGLAATVLAVLWVFSWSDLLFKYNHTGRLTLWLVLLAIAVTGITFIVRLWMKERSVLATAARIEQAFPELDNHLINLLQFAEDPRRDALKQAYVRHGVPQWSGLDFAAMKSRPAHRRAYLALGVSLALMILPILVRGNAWAVAVRRLVNPFSALPPVTLTQILEITPGQAHVRQGRPVVLGCRVRGKPGHRVRLEIQPADGHAATYALGRIPGAAEEAFTYKIPNLTGGMRYRFQAGDAPKSAWYQITPRAPLALTRARVAIDPPAYTGRPASSQDALTTALRIPAGSLVTLAIACNASLRQAAVYRPGAPPVDLQPDAASNAWTGVFSVDGGNALRIEADAAYGETLSSAVDYQLLPDQPPAIDVLAPRGHLVLPPGEPPVIDVTIRDDYALTRVALYDRSGTDAGATAAAAPVAVWDVPGRKATTLHWQGDPPHGTSPSPLAFQVVAYDNRTGTNNVATSAPILFHRVDLPRAESLQASLHARADTTLARVIKLQRGNIEATRHAGRDLDQPAPAPWETLQAVQRTIRTQTKALLALPTRPLGSLTESVKQVYVNDMLFVIEDLGRVPALGPQQRPAAYRKALHMEEKILRILTYADAASAQARVKQSISLLQGLLEALIKGQGEVIARTKAYAARQAEIGELLIDRQDALAVDLTAFLEACRTTATRVRSNEPQLADAYARAAQAGEQERIREDMLLAAEELDRNRAPDALPHEQKALAKLDAIRAGLEAIQTAQAEETTNELLDVLGAAREKIARIKALHQRALETMEVVKANQNLDTKATDLLEEEYAELLRNTRDALLQVPTDLHIFQELNAANDIVEDVITIFQEVEQEAGSEEALQNDDVVELAFTKDGSLELLDALEEAEDRLEDWEIWLDEKPDTEKVTVEAMDQEEMPAEGAALGALESQVEDIISDLLEESDDPEDQAKADDGAINRAVSDMAMGGPVVEGDIATFAAKGKSGNEAPDHKEQDGRSNVGRQGMSSGETAAGSGTIQEGDNNIEARRTQDPTQSGQVDAEGDADTKAFGGGKQGTGRADDVGAGRGGTQRMDSSMAGGKDGMEALMVKVERMYEQASLKNVRAPSLQRAAHHLRQAGDAIAQARSIDQVRELKQRAAMALKQAKTELGAGPSVAIGSQPTGSLIEEVVEGGPDEAPARYRELVSEYYRALTDEL